jgi:hypothetical protein
MLLQNVLACFLSQTHKDKYLLIGDDSCELSNQEENNWAVASLPLQHSLPAKYNLLATEAIRRWNPDALAVFEDDDVYFPNYLGNHVKALEQNKKGWSHCSWCWTDGSGGGPVQPLLREETGHSRLHGCLSMSTLMFQRIGGWVETNRMDFDLQLLARLNQESNPCDPCLIGPSQYFFRWVSTGQPHGQGFAKDPGDTQWLVKAQAAVDANLGRVIPAPKLVPSLDSETSNLFSEFTF